ncbi:MULTISPECIES: hypothetical protein [Streptomyces]|uniref:Uncharacterized protein n=1 Tax=Streptomyces doebereineriae TaxID=3075528 RepID=A0ABU2VG99_9ACTN|nr:hypothetical protein [Streptomyces sp. DSM 41640]MDT0484611.1 hypothetical protein [Streptomyces sp. DSM 41640]
MSPDSTGFGSADGHDTDNFRLFTVIVANGPVPPPDNTNGDSDKPGTTAPDFVRRNVASRDFHDPPRINQRGCAETWYSNVPSGSANVCDASVRSSRTSTRDRCAFADIIAATASGRDATGTTA